jgi:hypothetical protein
MPQWRDPRAGRSRGRSSILGSQLADMATCHPGCGAGPVYLLVVQCPHPRRPRGLGAPSPGDLARRGESVPDLRREGRRHPVECHEVWEYGDARGVQRLVRLTAIGATIITRWSPDTGVRGYLAA